MDISQAFDLIRNNNIEYFSLNDKVYLFGNTNKIKNKLSERKLLQLKPFLKKDLNECLFKVNLFQRSLIYHELFEKQKSNNTLMYILDIAQNQSKTSLVKVLNDIFMKWPILTSTIVEKNLEFFFKWIEITDFDQLIATDNKLFNNECEFFQEYSNFYIPLFNNGMIRFIIANISGEWRIVLCLHHIVYDDTFICFLMNHIGEIMNSSITTISIPDFNFIQENWNINNLADKDADKNRIYWKNFSCITNQNLFIRGKPTNYQTKMNNYVPLLFKNLKVLPLSLILLLIYKLFSEQFNITDFFALITIKNRLSPINNPTPGYATSLVPFYLTNTYAENNSKSLENINKILLEHIQHSNFPQEELLNTAKIKKDDILCLVNVLNVTSSSMLNLIGSIHKNKSRVNITITLFIINNSDLLIDVKSELSEINAQAVCDSLKDYLKVFLNGCA